MEKVTGFKTGHSDKSYGYFLHPYNCGVRLDERRSERTVELALMDAWLNQAEDVWEVGAVTPYYWPNRIKNIVDPADRHPLVNHRASLFDLDFSGKDVLCVSTIEHIGAEQYGLSESRSPIEALEKLNNEARRLLITFPIGFNQKLDDYITKVETVPGCTLSFLVRGEDENWKPARGVSELRPWGDRRQFKYPGLLGRVYYKMESAVIRVGLKEFKPWANSICVIERGNLI